MKGEILDVLEGVIQYLKRTKDDQWLMRKCATKEQDKWCLRWHIVKYGESEMIDAWSLFENCIANEFMIYPVNDWEDPRYKQATPKERCIAYLQDIHDWVQPNILQLMEMYSA